jgi:hypothetical protein
MGIVWELDGKSSPHPFKKKKKHPLGACLCHPIGSPLQKIRSIGAPHMLYPNVFILGTTTRIGFAHV